MEHEGRTWGKFLSMLLLRCKEPSFLKLQFVHGLNDDQTIHRLNKYVHGDAPLSPLLDPLEGLSRLSCGKLGLEGRSRLPALERGRGAC